MRRKCGSASKVRHEAACVSFLLNCETQQKGRSVCSPTSQSRYPCLTFLGGKLTSLIARANRELASYDGLLHALVNPLILLSPLATQEAVLSSKIEGTQATLEEVLEFEAKPCVEDQRKQADIQEVLNDRSAMEVAISELKRRPLTLNLIKSVHEVLMDHVRGHDKRRGDFRTMQNWIGTPGCSINEASFVPPSPLELLKHLDNFEKYFHFEDVDFIAQAGILHAQFELIHPFTDGNGRLGRMLIPLFLFQHSVISTPSFYLSAYFESKRDEYYERLRGISQGGNWEGWVAFFLHAVIEQAVASKATVKKILSLYEEMKKRVPTLTRSAHATMALDLLFSKPIFSSTDFSARAKIPKATAARLLKVLEHEGVIVLSQASQGREASVYAFIRLLKLVS
jgi:Fic family protein